MGSYLIPKIHSIQMLDENGEVITTNAFTEIPSEPEVIKGCCGTASTGCCQTITVSGEPMTLRFQKGGIVSMDKDGVTKDGRLLQASRFDKGGKKIEGAKFAGLYRAHCAGDNYWGEPATDLLYVPEVERIITSDRTTIVLWQDGSKTVVRCGDDEEPSKFDGFAAAVLKKMFGTTTAAKKYINAHDEEVMKAKALAEKEKRRKEHEEAEKRKQEKIEKATMKRARKYAEAFKKVEGETA